MMAEAWASKELDFERRHLRPSAHGPWSPDVVKGIAKPSGHRMVALNWGRSVHAWFCKSMLDL